NYAAAKAGIAIMTRVWSQELERFDVKVNAIAPLARTRITEQSFGNLAVESGFDVLDPANVAPLAIFLASDLSNNLSGEVFGLHGADIDRHIPWTNPKMMSKETRWSVQEIAARVKELF